MTRSDARLAETPFDPAEELAALTRNSTDAGAVVSFVGLVRGSAENGEIEALRLDHHPTLTLPSLESIAAEAAARFDIVAVRVVHRFGLLAPGEPIVFAGASARHRRSAFDAADYLMDRLKTEAIFWKREEDRNSGRWIEPTDADRLARARWD